MSKLNEQTDKLVKVTSDKGEETIERVPEGTVDDLRKSGVDFEDPKTGQKNVGRTVYEGQEDNQADAINVAKELGKCLRDALREHGDEMQTMSLKNLNTRGVTVKVIYKPDEQGQQTEDEFKFTWDNGHIQFDNGGEAVDLGQIQNRSGRSTIQKDLMKSNLLSFLDSHDTTQTPVEQPAEMPEGTPLNEESCLWESEEAETAFRDALDVYKTNKSKDSLKALLKSCRPFRKGNTLQEKFRGAYNWSKENPPKNTKKEIFLEDHNSDGDWDLYFDIFKTLAGLRENWKELIGRGGEWETDGEFDVLYQDYIHLVKDMRRYYDLYCQPDSLDEDRNLDEFIDLNDPIANGKKKNPDTIEPNYDWEKDDINERDEYGPEVGDQVDYEGGNYKLYGYCGNEVVLQNVDDDRDFKVVKPADIGIGFGQKQVDEEIEYVDPENLPDDEEERI